MTSIPLADAGDLRPAARRTLAIRDRARRGARRLSIVAAVLVSRHPHTQTIVTLPRALVGDRRARRLGEHLVRHVLAHRRDALVARAERRPLRPRRLLRPGVRGAAAGDARVGPRSRSSATSRCRRRTAGFAPTLSAEPVGERRSARARRSPPGSSSRTGSRSQDKLRQAGRDPRQRPRRRPRTTCRGS